MNSQFFLETVPDLFLFLLLYRVMFLYHTVNRFYVDFQKINIRAARDATAAGRYGGAPREHLIFFKRTVPGPLISTVAAVLLQQY